MSQAYKSATLNLRQTRFRGEPVIEALIPIARKYFEAQGTYTPAHIKYVISVCREVYEITGNERLALLGLFHDEVGNYARLQKHFSSFIMLNRITDLPPALLNLVNWVNSERLHKLTYLDRDKRPIHVRLPEYEQEITPLSGEDIIRAIAIANITKPEIADLRAMYEKSRLDPNTPKLYRDPIACVYLAALQRGKTFFHKFDTPSKHLGEALALAVDPEMYRLVRAQRADWSESIENIVVELNEILSGRSRGLEELRAMTLDGRIVASQKDELMQILKVVLEKLKEDPQMLRGRGGGGTRLDSQRHRQAIKDMIRIGLDVKNSVDPRSALSRLMSILSDNTFTILGPNDPDFDLKKLQRVPTGLNPFEVESYLDPGTSLWFGVLKSPARLSPEGLKFLIELRSRREKDIDILDTGKNNHEAMLAERIRSTLGIPKGVPNVLSPELLLALEIRARVFDELFDLAGHPKPKEQPDLMRVNVIVQYADGTNGAYPIALYQGSVVADAVASVLNVTSPGLEIEVVGRKKSADRKDPLRPDDNIFIRVNDEPSVNPYSAGPVQYREDIQHVYSQAAQIQYAIALEDMKARKKAGKKGKKESRAR